MKLLSFVIFQILRLLVLTISEIFAFKNLLKFGDKGLICSRILCKIYKFVNIHLSINFSALLRPNFLGQFLIHCNVNIKRQFCEWLEKACRTSPSLFCLIKKNGYFLWQGRPVKNFLHLCRSLREIMIKALTPIYI